MKRYFALILAAALLFGALGAAAESELSLYEAVRAQAGKDVSGFTAELIGGGTVTGEAF